MWAKPPQECHEWDICTPSGHALSSCWALTLHSLIERQGQAPASSHPHHYPFYGVERKEDSSSLLLHMSFICEIPLALSRCIYFSSECLPFGKRRFSKQNSTVR